MDDSTSTRSAPSRRHIARKLGIALLLVALALAAGYGSLEYVGQSNTAVAGVCGQFSLTRHGLPCDIPLPSDATFIRSASGAYPLGNHIRETSWTYRTSQSLAQIGNLYNQGLGAWWTCSEDGPAFYFGLTGGENPNRANTTVEIQASQSSPRSSQLTVSLIQSGLPFWWACNGFYNGSQ